MLTRIDRFLGERSTAFHVVLALSLVFALAFLDYVAGGQTGFTVFFLIPIVIGTWYAGRWLGLITAVLSSFLWFLANLSIGHYFPASAEPYFVWNALMRLVLFLIVIYMVWRLKTALEREKELSRTDPLTGAVNRRYFRNIASEEIQRAGRYGHSFSLAYLDLDNFKEVNDTLGHSAGDQALQVVVDTMEHVTRSTDVVARLGGDEFAVLFPETGADAGREAARHLQGLLLDAMREHDWPVTFSIGLVTFEEPPASVNEMIKVADRLMYSVKDTTKNAIAASVVG
ncbi:MAG: diguanylate cyclase [Actinobacteria bacterium]|nr:diguanylate cyclase [Actinomycetota bacterium]